MKTIENREDISKLVNLFYIKIRKDDLLGPIFNNHIPEDHWPMHLEKLTDFWETKLFGIKKFNGNPPAKHINVDNNTNHTIDQSYFDRWLKLWFETLDKLHEGELALRAKEISKNMAKGQLSIMMNNRTKDSRPHYKVDLKF